MLHRNRPLQEIVSLLQRADDRELVIALEFIRALTQEDYASA